jgi:hypothetical protein
LALAVRANAQTLKYSIHVVQGGLDGGDRLVIELGHDSNDTSHLRRHDAGVIARTRRRGTEEGLVVEPVATRGVALAHVVEIPTEGRVVT